MHKKIVDVIEIPDTPDGQIALSSCVMERLFPDVATKPSPVVGIPDWLKVGQSSTSTAYSGEIMSTL
jgi:hypothetical protein